MAKKPLPDFLTKGAKSPKATKGAPVPKVSAAPPFMAKGGKVKGKNC